MAKDKGIGTGHPKTKAEELRGGVTQEKIYKGKLNERVVGMSFKTN